MGLFGDESYVADAGLLVTGLFMNQIWSWLKSSVYWAVYGFESPASLSKRICGLIEGRAFLRGSGNADVSNFSFKFRPAPSPVSDALHEYFSVPPNENFFPISSSYVWYGKSLSGKTLGASFFIQELTSEISYQGADWTGLPGICFSPSILPFPGHSYEDYLRGLLDVDPAMDAVAFRQALYDGMHMAAMPGWMERAKRFYDLHWHKKEHVVKPVVVIFDAFDRAGLEWFNVFNFASDCMRQFANTAVVPIFITSDLVIANQLSWLNNGSRIRPHPAVYDPNCPFGIEEEIKKGKEIKWVPIRWDLEDYERLVKHQGRRLAGDHEPLTPRQALAESAVDNAVPPAHELGIVSPHIYVPPIIDQGVNV
jgi:hypothetical protein